jgi:dephospho-CoA kinase
MRTFGLTGGIASGKSTVAARFRSRGLRVLDADVVAREVVDVGTPGLAAVRAAFGCDVFSGDSLDRKKLGALIFADAKQRAVLNGIVHPLVAARTAETLQAYAESGSALACYEVPLLFENHLEEGLRPVVLVAIPRDTQIERLMKRDCSTREAAEARIDAQHSLGEKRAKSDYVIENTGMLESLHTEADRVLDALCDALKMTRFRP